MQILSLDVVDDVEVESGYRCAFQDCCHATHYYVVDSGAVERAKEFEKIRFHVRFEAATWYR